MYSLGIIVQDKLLLPLRTEDPRTDCEIDFEATLAYCRHRWSLDFGIAEAMDTAQRGMGLNWQVARDLISFSCVEARSAGGAIACGVSTETDPARFGEAADEAGLSEDPEQAASRFRIVLAIYGVS